MTSTNGKIPAGSVNLNLSAAKQASNETCTTIIEKCPDKSAHLLYTYSLDYLRNIARPASNTKQNSLYSRYDELSNGSASRLRTTSNSPSFNNLHSPSYNNLRTSVEKLNTSSNSNLKRRDSNGSSSAHYQLTGRGL